MVSSPAPGAKAGEAADAMDVGQMQSEPESDGQEEEWEYDYYAVVPEGGGAGGDGWMGAVEMDTAGGSGANADWVRKYPQLDPLGRGLTTSVAVVLCDYFDDRLGRN